MFPQPDAAPLPCGSAPLKLTGAATSAAPGAANVISPSEGVHAVSAQHCGFGRGVASGPQVSVALPALRPVAPPGALRLLWRIVLRFYGEATNRACGRGPDRRSRFPQRSANFLTSDTAHRMMDGLMDRKMSSQDRLSKGEALIAILLLSLCIGPVVWELASVVLRYL
jgi:hypothetical protein